MSCMESTHCSGDVWAIQYTVRTICFASSTGCNCGLYRCDENRRHGYEDSYLHIVFQITASITEIDADQRPV